MTTRDTQKASSAGTAAIDGPIINAGRKDGAISFSQALALSLPAMPLFALMMPIVVYLPAFYAEDMGLGLAIVGTLFMAARLWDMVTDPLFGFWADRAKLPFGRRRPWLVIGTPLLMLSTYMLFIPPEGVGAFHLGFWLFVLYVGWTLSILSLFAWASESSPNYHDRSRVMGMIQAANIAGSVFVLVLPVIADQIWEGGAALRMSSMAWFIVLLLPLFVAITVTKVPEAPPPESTEQNIFRVLTTMWRNASFRRLVGADLMAGLIIGINGSLVLFFATHTLKLGPQASILLLINFAAGLAAIPFWIWAAGRYGKDRIFALQAAYQIFGASFFLWLPAHSFGLAAVGYLLVGFNLGAIQFLPRAILSDIIDEAELETGKRNEAAFFALLTTTLKGGLALAVGLSFYSLAAIGFDPRSTSNTPEAIEGIRYVIAGYQVLFSLAIIGLMWRFPLSQERHSEIRLQLDARTR